MNAPPPASDAAPIPTTPRTPLAWLPVADAAIALLVVLLAGFVAAFVSRNSDQWLHFAAGRDLLSGKYSLGTDPYSYLHDNQSWTNHSWLYDVAAYQLYSISGSAVTLCKAIVFAMAFFVVLRIRKPGTPSWPWWLFATVGILAAAPHTSLRPEVVSALLVALTQYVLFRSEWRSGSWRNPILLAVITGLWANIDQWFFLAPATIAMVLLAEFVQRAVSKNSDTDSPRSVDLLKALGLSVLATFLNPHLHGVWVLPFELSIPDSFRLDPALATYALPGFSRTFYERPQLGGNLNGAAFLVMLIVGGGLLALGLSRVRLACLFVWMLYAALALLNSYCILFFAIVAVPMAAIPLADIASRFADDSKSRLASTLSPLARALAIPAMLVLLCCAWPGWLHPKPGDLAYARRVALGVEPDPGSARIAKTISGWRQKNQLADMKGTPVELAVANHMAWFAPNEKVAVNGRLAHHRSDLPLLLKARAAAADARADLNSALTALQADYLVLASRSQNRAIDVSTLHDRVKAPLDLWHLDGRTAVVGTANSKLRFDPVSEAFAATQAPLLEPNVGPPPSRTHDLFDEFVMPTKPVPLESLDAAAWQMYASQVWLQTVRNQQQRSNLNAALGGPMALWAVTADSQILDQVAAANLLAQRAARQAIALNPDHPLAYFALAFCLLEAENVLPGFSHAEQEALIALNCRRYLDRAPLPSEITDLGDATSVRAAAELLTNYYQQRQMQDFARDAGRKAIEAARREMLLTPDDSTPQQQKAKADQLDQVLAAMDQQYAQRLENYQSSASAPIQQRYVAAMQNQLPGEALKLLKSADLQKEFGPAALLAELEMAQIRLKAGLLDDAVQTLNSIQEKLKTPAADADARAVQDQVARQLIGVIGEAHRLAGDYDAYAKFLDQHIAPKQPMPAVMRDRLKAALASPAAFEAQVSGAAHGAVGGVPALLLMRDLEGQIVNDWLRESEYYQRRGLVAILNGQMKEAKSYFEQSMAPEGIAMPAFLGKNTIAERYLKLITTAQRGQ